MKKTTMYWPEDLERALAGAAHAEGRSVAALVRDAVEQYLAKAPKRMPRSVGVAQGPDDGREMPDVMRELRKAHHARLRKK